MTEGDRLLLTPTYHVFEMYKVHHNAALLPTHQDCEPYELGGGTMPPVSA